MEGKLLTKKRIGVLMGGISAEREVSLRSGKAIFNALRNLGYDVSAIDVGRDICKVLGREKIEIAFLALHGGFGEDGCIQGLLEVMEIPYTGSGVLASSLAMDKLSSKVMFISEGLAVPKFEKLTSFKIPEIPLPIVVKPQKEGSSVGVSIVRDETKLREAVETALSFNGVAIAEEYIDGKEIHIGILNNIVLGGVEVRPLVEFYSYEAKYTEGMTEYIIPPEIDDASYEKAKDTALSAHQALGSEGATRVDLRLDRAGKPYVLEVNTIPGMTETSLLPKIASHRGLSFPMLVEEILRSAIEKSKVKR
ncbi:MAG: D-alanine--D-alanine ligase [Nitrospirae bacterium]|nr:D-alanine--D-alanine ligase [Nitrospirota bacterium]